MKSQNWGTSAFLLFVYHLHELRQGGEGVEAAKSDNRDVSLRLNVTDSDTHVPILPCNTRRCEIYPVAHRYSTSNTFNQPRIKN